MATATITDTSQINLPSGPDNPSCSYTWSAQQTSNVIISCTLMVDYYDSGDNLLSSPNVALQPQDFLHNVSGSGNGNWSAYSVSYATLFSGCPANTSYAIYKYWWVIKVETLGTQTAYDNAYSSANRVYK